MSDYLVKSKLEDTEWQIKSDARDHNFICDVSDDKHNAGPLIQLNICAAALILALKYLQE